MVMAWFERVREPTIAPALTKQTTAVIRKHLSKALRKYDRRSAKALLEYGRLRDMNPDPTWLAIPGTAARLEGHKDEQLRKAVAAERTADAIRQVLDGLRLEWYNPQTPESIKEQAWLCEKGREWERREAEKAAKAAARKAAKEASA